VRWPSPEAKAGPTLNQAQEMDQQEKHEGGVAADRIDGDAYKPSQLGCLTEALVCLSTPASTKVNGDPAKALLRTWICFWTEDSGTSPASTLPPARRTENLRAGLGFAAWENSVRRSHTSYTRGLQFSHCHQPSMGSLCRLATWKYVLTVIVDGTSPPGLVPADANDISGRALSSAGAVAADDARAIVAILF